MPEAIQPTDFREALEFARARGILPTQLSSQDLRELSAEMRRRSLFSARVTNAQFLQELADQIEELQQGRTNLATAMMDMREVLTELDYTPETGFPGDAARGIPPAEKYDLRDISSHKRLSLMLETNQAQAYGEGRRQQGNTREAVAQFPAWELIRISPRRVPRGFQSTKTGLMPVPGDSWQERFVRAGGTLVGDGRMIARKDDTVWERLGDSNEFPDGLDQPFPPFAFNSGMDWRAVPRREAIALGIIDPGEDAIPEDGVRFTGAFDIQSDQFDPALYGELQRELSAELANRAALTQFDSLLNRLESALLNTFDPDQARASDGKWTADPHETPRGNEPAKKSVLDLDMNMVEGSVGGLPITTSRRGLIQKVSKKTAGQIESALAKPEIQESLRRAGIYRVSVRESGSWSAGHHNGALLIHPRTAEHIEKSPFPERREGGIQRVIHHEAGHGVWQHAPKDLRDSFEKVEQAHPEIRAAIGKYLRLTQPDEHWDTDEKRPAKEVHAELYAMKRTAPEKYAAIPAPVREVVDKFDTVEAPEVPEHIRKHRWTTY